MRQQLRTKGNYKFLDGISKEMTKTVEDELAKTNELIADKARNDVPVDTGFLKNSIITDYPNSLTGKVIVNANYSPYIEFGTGGLVDVPAGLSSYAMQFKGKGIKQVNLPARPFLYPNWKMESNKMLERLKDKVNGK